MKRTRRAVSLAVAVLLLAVGGALVWGMLSASDDAGGMTGLVVDPAGEPIADAEVTGPEGAQVRTGSDGRFSVAGERGWVTATATGWVPRSRMGVAGDDLVIRLAPRTADTVTFAFGGDVMFGRRYFDPSEDGSRGGLLEPGSSPEEHAALVSAVAPMFEGADLATVNLETPLIDEPFYDITERRPARFHPTKDYAFASAPAAAAALRGLGIDVVGLGNNHLYDALERGVRSTREALDAAGYGEGTGYFGAGPDAASAWRPAYREVRGQRVAFVGCTSILGDDQLQTYVAGPDKGGAARCAPGLLRRAVSRAARAADIVVASVHGGFEYGRDPSEQVRALSDVAVGAGATMVINHHPHVVGGLRFDDGTLTAWTLGNLLFDQTVWPTFESYVLQVAVAGGEVVSAWVEPIRIQGYEPTPVTGEHAEWVAQGALARSVGPWLVDDDSLWLDRRERRRQDTISVPRGRLVRIDEGCAAGAGRELLWTGDFEGLDLDDTEASLWNAADPTAYRKVDSGAARTGEHGVLLHRGSGNDSDVLLSVNHRVLVDPRDELTFLSWSRGRFGGPDAELRLSWYNDTRGGSQKQTVVPLPVGEEWQPLRVDVTVPRNAIAVQPFIALEPPDDGVSQLAVDDVALVNWNEPGCGYLRMASTVSDLALPPTTPSPQVTEIDATPVAVSAPRRLPPGPPELRE